MFDTRNQHDRQHRTERDQNDKLLLTRTREVSLSVAEDQGPKIEPLISAAEVFPELEQQLLKAVDRAIFAFRIFDTRTKLRTDAARSFAGGEDWAALIAAKAEAGLTVRVLISDFDPIGASSLHSDAWSSVDHLAMVLKRRHTKRAGRVEVICARHPAELGCLMRWVLTPLALYKLRQLRRQYPTSEAAREAHMPGLAEALESEPPYRLFPVTHHQKLAIFDGRQAVLGGLDVDERRWDDLKHDRPAQETWHDVSLALRNVDISQIEGFVAALWYDCLDRLKATSVGISHDAFDQPTPMPDRSMDGAASDVGLQITRSVPSNRVFSLAPKNVESSIKDGLIDLIDQSQRWIYIETQFLRSQEIAEALARAARRNLDLEAVVLLPFAPEQFAFDGARDSTVEHAEYLQYRAIQTVRAAFGDRSAFLSPGKPQRPDANDQFTAHGAGIVYLHSKVFISDQRQAMIGSANLNGRSLRWDTEAALIWKNSAGVAGLQKRLAEKWLGRTDEPVDRVQTWANRAQANLEVSAAERTGFVLPYDLKRPRKFAIRHWFLPDNFF